MIYLSFFRLTKNKDNYHDEITFTFKNHYDILYWI